MAETLAGADDHTGFVRSNTRCQTPPLIPEVKLRLASKVLPLWRMSEEMLTERGLPPPYWAFAWAGGQALARHVLDNPHTVKGQRVLDFASGSGLVAIASALAGSASVTAADIDPFALAAIKLNAASNLVDVFPTGEDLVERQITGFDVVLAGDICYEQPFARRATTWLHGLSREGVTVLVGDPGRTYLPRDQLERVASYEVKTTRELEDCALRRTGVWQFRS